MSAIILEEFNIAGSLLFEDTVFNNPFRLRRSQILVARIPPPRAQRAVRAQCILDLILREIISHLRSEMLLNLIRSTNIPHLRSEMLLNLIRSTNISHLRSEMLLNLIRSTNISHLRSEMFPNSTNISHLRRDMLPNLIVLPIFRSYGAYGRRSLLQILTSMV